MVPGGFFIAHFKSVDNVRCVETKIKFNREINLIENINSIEELPSIGNINSV